jgi:hypothetical protein
MKPKFVLLLFFTGIFFLAKANASGTGEESAKKSDILGGVYSHDKKPLGSVIVTAYVADKKEKVVITDDAGVYAFDDLKAGIYKFVFEKDGYKKVTKERVVVHQDSGAQMNIEMSEHASFELLPGPFHFTDFH